MGWVWLGAIVLLGACLRFWNLDYKPIWSDEVLTALFGLGRSFAAVPLNRVFSVAALDQLFTLNPATSCSQIAQTVATESVHPPLFFCWLYQWSGLLDSFQLSWLWKLRSLPALAGVLAIGVVYQLNRIAFSARAGLMAAAVMAVSPYALYLSQEARHYTIPLVLVGMALLGLYQLQVDILKQRFRPLVWFGWIAVNSLGFYVHYFFLLAFMAQVGSLLVNVVSLRFLPLGAPIVYPLVWRRSLLAIGLATIGVGLTYLPWLPTLVSHLTRPETDWLELSNPGLGQFLGPLYRLPIGWILMLVALPVENQPLGIAIPAVVLMVSFISWLLWQLRARFGQLWGNPQTHLASRLLVVFVLTVLVEFLAIVYLLGKDITLVPRYNFIYFPAVCALVGAALAQPPVSTSHRRPHPQLLVGSVLLVGFLSSLLVIWNQVFLKPYEPDRVAATLAFEPERPVLVSMAYGDLQDIALGLSFALALGHQPSQQTRDFVFLPRLQSYTQVWQRLAALDRAPSPPLNLWVIAPGLRRLDYPDTLTVAGQRCPIDRNHYDRVGVPYQLYRCD